MSDSDFSEIVRAAFLDEAGEMLRRAEIALTQLKAPEPEGKVEALMELRRVLHTLKGTGAACGFDHVRDISHHMEARLQEIDDPHEQLQAGTVEDLFIELDMIHHQLSPETEASDEAREPSPPEGLSEGLGPGTSGEDLADQVTGAAKSDPPSPRAPEEARPAEPRRREKQVVRIRSDRLDELHTLVGELVVDGLQGELLGRQVHDIRETMTELAREIDRVRTDVLASKADLPEATFQRLRQSAEGLLASSEEALSMASQAARDAPMIQAQSAAAIKALDQALAELRLVKLQTFLESFARITREAARAAKKEVQLAVSAGEAEMDHMVLARLREPLIHLVRNAVAHGVEPPEGRLAAGKPETGTIRLDAVCRGGQAILRVIDDGAGVDPEAVRARAQAAGIDVGSEPLDDRRLLDLLAHPGFSTQSKADDLSGRGVGLDVVASSIRKLDGQLTLDSMAGIGSVFTIEVPITASTTSGCRVTVEGREFGLMMKQVERIVRIPRSTLLEIEGRQVLDLEGASLPVASLATLIGVSSSPPAENEMLVAVVVRLRKERLALLVDSIPEEQTLVVRSLGPAFANSRLFLGGAVLADHSVLPLVHIPELFRRAGNMGRSLLASSGTSVSLFPSESSHESLRPRAPRVLAVDDSLPIRLLMRKMLEGAGFEVTLANDGAAAVQVFSTASPAFDLVVTDLEMPELDGVGLTRAVRTSSRPHTPILMVTSVETGSQRQQALEAGADSYLVKKELQEDAFLQVVRRLTGIRSATP